MPVDTNVYVDALVYAVNHERRWRNGHGGRFIYRQDEILDTVTGEWMRIREDHTVEYYAPSNAPHRFVANLRSRDRGIADWLCSRELLRHNILDPIEVTSFTEYLNHALKISFRIKGIPNLVSGNGNVISSDYIDMTEETILRSMPNEDASSILINKLCR